jgi:CHRD domain/PEP-CTERM motif
MFQRLFALIVAFLLLVAASRAQASTILLAHLTNDQENPPTVPTLQDGGARPASFGDAFFELNDAMDALTFTATIFNIDFTGSQTSDLNDNLTVAHIHAPAPNPTVNAGVVWGFHGMPFNDTNPNDVVFSPFAIGVGGTISGKWDALEGNNTNLAAQLPNILSGQAYINFHTTQFGGGEVRGAINAVPEPGTLTLLGLCVAGLLGGARLRRDNRG